MIDVIKLNVVFGDGPDRPIIADFVAETAHGHQVFHLAPLMVQPVKPTAASFSKPWYAV